MSNTPTTLEKLMQKVNAINFQNLYHKTHQCEMFRRKSRKNLLIFSLIYSGLMIFLVTQIF